MNGIIYFLLLSALLYSCGSKLSEKNEKTSGFLKKINQFELMIPQNIKHKGSFFIWRLGSIQWASDASLLILQPKRKGTKEISVYYLQFNENSCYVESKEPKPIMNIYKFNLKDSIDELTISTEKKVFVDYIISKGEGYCSNQYFYKNIGEDSMILINNNDKLSKNTKFLFKQISPQEHFQCYSLFKDCSMYSKVAYKLLTDGKNEEGLKYQLLFNPAKRHD